MRTLWNSLYDKVRAQVTGLIAGLLATGGLIELLNAADTTDLSASQQWMWALAVAAVAGVLNAYRRPETHDPMRDHHTPGEQ